MRRDWLEVVEKALSKEGFRPTWIQLVKNGQVFGLVKDIGRKWQMHVRGFNNGWLEAEIEVSRHYVQHHVSRYRRDGIRELVQILERHRIPYQIEGQLPEECDAVRGPRRLTSWQSMGGWIGIAAFVVAFACLVNRAWVRVKQFLSGPAAKPQDLPFISYPLPSNSKASMLALGLNGPVEIGEPLVEVQPVSYGLHEQGEQP